MWPSASGAGRCPAAPARRPGVIDEFLPKLEELVERSKGKIRADVAHEKITAMGYAGSERTTRRAVARLKEAWQAGRRRVLPAVDPGAGHVGAVRLRRRAGGRRRGDGAVLPVAGLVPVPGGAAAAGQDRPSVWAAVDVALRRPGGVPAYLLTDNEKTVTVEHVAGIPVRNPGAVEFGRHYGLTVATCVPYDPASKGGSESTVKLAKADLVPDRREPAAASTAASRSWRRRARCSASRSTPGRTGSPAGPRRRCWPRSGPGCTRSRPRRSPRRSGVTRRVDAMSLVTFEGGQYSVPHQLAGQAVYVRRHGEPGRDHPRRARQGRPRWPGTRSPRRAARGSTRRTTRPRRPAR